MTHEDGWEVLYLKAWGSQDDHEEAEMDEEMKPCPFCGSGDVELISRFKASKCGLYTWTDCWVECGNDECGGRGPEIGASGAESKEAEELAVKLWNRRPL